MNLPTHNPEFEAAIAEHVQYLPRSRRETITAEGVEAAQAWLLAREEDRCRQGVIRRTKRLSSLRRLSLAYSAEYTAQLLQERAEAAEREAGWDPHP